MDKNFHEISKAKNDKLAVKINKIAKCHIDSFNFFVDKGLNLITKNMKPINIHKSNFKNTKITVPFDKMTIKWEKLEIGMSEELNEYGVKIRDKYPYESRLIGDTYNSNLYATFTRILDDNEIENCKINLGKIPIMVNSNRCNLYNLEENTKILKKEDCCETGGYFIINGLEKLLRLIVVPKKNYPLGLMRNFSSKHKDFSNYAIQMKCTREDLHSQTIYLFYSTNGSVYLSLMIKKKEYIFPLSIILKSLKNISDLDLYNKIVRGQINDSFITERAEILIKEADEKNLNNQEQNLNYLGFLAKAQRFVTQDSLLNNYELGELFLKEYIMIHQNSNTDKINTLCLMINKLFMLISNKLEPDNLDSLINHDILLPGHFYMIFFKEKLEETLDTIKIRLEKELNKTQSGDNDDLKLRNINFLEKILSQTQIGRKIEYLLSTGNLKSMSGLDMMQNSGYSIIAERLNNMRFLSHLKSIHRGAYFTEMKTTKVRKLLPDSWGFMCPVHTPDGHLCGLLNHLSSGCEPQCDHPNDNKNKFIRLLCELGMQDIKNITSQVKYGYDLDIYYNGNVIGYIDNMQGNNFCMMLRKAKIDKNIKEVNEILSITCIPYQDEKYALYPGIYLFDSIARPLRKVKNLIYNCEEIIDPLEQIFMNIICFTSDLSSNSTHQELEMGEFLSELSTQIPFIGHNQSPRNMYQCQMAKQTMGISNHCYDYRTDNKIYRIITPQIPIIRCKDYDTYGFHEHPSGTNSVVAVISYTGYDIEDAMIINKSSYQRGFKNGCVYKTVRFNLSTEENKKSPYSNCYMEYDKIKANELNIDSKVDKDGLPKIGSEMSKGKTEMIYYDNIKNDLMRKTYRDQEKSYLDQICLYSKDGKNNKIGYYYKYRYPRNPIIGDKFSSRHGQKGVLSILYPSEDMPFTESGITPDIIINPNAFPSRMTIGMLIESIAGKNACIRGKPDVNKPFEAYKDDDVIDYYGNKLLKYGYNYYGSEVMYSGIYGTQFQTDIFIGVVYYQRLRHMISDKFQARNEGPIDILTRQPIKGRKKGGGIRFGEMERDALIAHGTSFCLRDRLFDCSDKSIGYLCTNCGNLLSTNKIIKNAKYSKEVSFSCLYCNDKQKIKKIKIPYVLRYLLNELAGMNIKLTLKLKKKEKIEYI